MELFIYSQMTKIQVEKVCYYHMVDRVEMKYRECICPLSRSVHCYFVRDGNRLKSGARAPTTPPQPGLIFHNGMYARNRQSPLCVLCGYYLLQLAGESNLNFEKSFTIQLY